MNTKTSLTVFSMALLLSVGSVAGGQSRKPTSEFDLRGKVLFSFTTEDYLIMTDRYLLTLKKEGLADSMRDRLSKASLQGSDIDVRVPVRSFASTVALIDQVSGVDRAVAGDEPMNMYSITAGLGYGAGFDMVRTQLLNDEPEILAPDQPDYVNAQGKTLYIAGRVVYSFDEEQVIVESLQTFHQLKRDRVLTSFPNLLDQPGAKIVLQVPLDGVLGVWSPFRDIEKQNNQAPLIPRLN